MWRATSLILLPYSCRSRPINKSLICKCNKFDTATIPLDSRVFLNRLSRNNIYDFSNEGTSNQLSLFENWNEAKEKHLKTFIMPEIDILLFKKNVSDLITKVLNQFSNWSLTHTNFLFIDVFRNQHHFKDIHDLSVFTLSIWRKSGFM